MAALLLVAAAADPRRSNTAAGAGPNTSGDWQWGWCDVCHMWVPGSWQAHESRRQHQDSLRSIEVHSHPAGIHCRFCTLLVHARINANSGCIQCVFGLSCLQNSVSMHMSSNCYVRSAPSQQLPSIDTLCARCPPHTTAFRSPQRVQGGGIGLLSL